MKSATITVTFNMRNAWDDLDTTETGLQPSKGVNSFLIDKGLSDELLELASRFGMTLQRWGVSVYDQEAP